MSPIPPNKDANPSKTNRNSSPDDVNVNQVDMTTTAATALADVLANQEGNESGEGSNEEANRAYEPLEQDPNAATRTSGPAHPGNDDDEDDDDDDDEETDSEPDELDPDEHFAMLASSRAFAKKGLVEPAVECGKYAHSFDCDVFERKRTLESEEIHLDESTSRQINNLMQNFKLPDASIPTWAKLVPEDVWKKNLLDCLNAKKLDLFDSENSQASVKNWDLYNKSLSW